MAQLHRLGSTLIRVKARKVRHATQRLDRLYAAILDGEISFAEFDASVQGWVNEDHPGPAHSTS